MAIEQRNRPLLNRKEFQQMGLIPITTAAAHNVVDDRNDNGRFALYYTSATVCYLYDHDQDSFMLIPSPGLTGAFGAGASGVFNAWSPAYTANGGSTTTITVAAATHNICGNVIGKTVEILTNAGGSIGERRIITQILNNAGAGTITLTVNEAFSAAIVNTNTFRISSGRFHLVSAGTLAAGSHKAFDLGTMSWSGNLSITGLPATLGTDGRMTQAYKLAEIYASGLASAGSTTTLTGPTGTTWIVDQWKDYYVVIINGTGESQTAKILSNTSNVLTFTTTLGVALDNTSRYEIRASFPFAIGVATAGGASTLTNSGKSWTTNQWANFQVRIISGTGVGQVRPIASNTGTVLTTSSAWTTNPDTTSVYEINGNENSLYYLGNNAVTLYRYSISGDSWSTVTPGTARAVAPGVGMTANWISQTGDSGWSNESDNLDGRYIYSFRGAGTANCDRYDIALNVWTAAAINYVGTETFTTGSGACTDGPDIILRKETVNRFFKYNVVKNVMTPMATNFFPDGVGLLGDKVWLKNYDPLGKIKWVYAMMNTGQVLHRIMIY